MASAPVVQSLGDLITEQTNALQPEQSQIDTQIAANDTSGSAQQAGLNAAKNTAFGGITQAANDRGAYFSGFTPNQEATYTGSTYLPALAKLQSTIDATKNTLLGQKAALNTTANTNALGEQKNQQAQLDSYNNAQATAAATAQAAADRNNTTLEAAQIRANATANRAPSASSTRAAQSASDFQAANSDLQGNTGKDGKVSPKFWAAAKTQWVNAGYSAASFNNNFSNYVNQSHAADYK